MSGIFTGAANIASSKIQADATKAAAAAQTAAANLANEQLQQRYDTTRSDLAPFRDVGHNASDWLNAQLPQYATPDNSYLNSANALFGQAQGSVGNARDLFAKAAAIGQGPGGMAALEATPGYQFELQQGLQAAQNSAAARGLGVSGAALRGAADYATGLASKNYQQQYMDAVQNGNNALSIAGGFNTLGSNQVGMNGAAQGNLMNSYNKLLGVAGQGESAASQTGTIGAGLANAASNNTTGAGNAQGASAIAGGNALASGINGVANAYQQNDWMNRMFPQQQGQQQSASSYTTQTNPNNGQNYLSSSNPDENF